MMSEDKLSDELLTSLDNSGDDGKVGVKVSITGVGSETIMVMNLALAAALGEEAGEDSAAEQQLTAEQQARADEIMEALKDVMDPELGINIADLDLLYGLHLDGDDLSLDMTLTSAGCPLTDSIDRQCRFVLNDLVDAVSINQMWLPSWDPDKIIGDGQEQLRALGLNMQPRAWISPAEWLPAQTLEEAPPEVPGVVALPVLPILVAIKACFRPAFI